jgi:hypothetical protein
VGNERGILGLYKIRGKSIKRGCNELYGFKGLGEITY